MVEVNCESDFVARTDDFQELVHDVAMHIAAADPQFVRKEDVTEEASAKEKRYPAGPRRHEGKPEKMLDKIVEGRMAKFYEEVCLLEQPFVKENTLTVGQTDQDQDRQAGREHRRRPFRPLQGGRYAASRCQRRKSTPQPPGSTQGMTVAAYTSASC